MLDGRSTLPCSVRKALYRAFREKHPTVIGGGALRPVFRRTFVPFTLKGPVDQRAQPDAPARAVDRQLRLDAGAERLVVDDYLLAIDLSRRGRYPDLRTDGRMCDRRRKSLKVPTHG